MGNHRSIQNEEDLRALKLGIPDVLVPGKTIAFRGGTIDQVGALQLVNAALAPIDNVNEQHLILHQAVVARDGQEEAVTQLIADLRAGAVVSLGENSSEFSRLGFKPRKKAAPLTPEEKQLKRARAKATRQARGTVSRKARAKIKGVVNPDGSAPPSSATTPPTKT
jgi:hypothetical protein